MTIVVPVAIQPAQLPLPDPADRATFTARKLEQLRWANNEYSTGSKALADASYANALDSHASATSAAISKTAVDANAALVASYAGAAPWGPGVYAQGARASSNINGRIYFKKTPSSVTSFDPSADLTNWAIVSTAALFEPITAAVTQAIAGGDYSLQNSTPQPAATNLAKNSGAVQLWQAVGGATLVGTYGPSPEGGVMQAIQATTKDSYVHCGSFAIPAYTNISFYIYLRRGTSETSVFTLYSGDLVTAIGSVLITWGAATPVATIRSGPVGGLAVLHMGNDVYRFSAYVSSGVATTGNLFVAPAGLSGSNVTVNVGEAQAETGTIPTSYIATGQSPVSRPSGVAAPQRIILPASPAENDYVGFSVDNGIATNIIDPNGKNFRGPEGLESGPMLLDNAAASGGLQFTKNAWRFV